MSHLPITTPSEAGPPPLVLEASPTFKDEWVRQHPTLSLLDHHAVITHLAWCDVACRYITGGADGAVKLWRSEPGHARNAAGGGAARHTPAGAAARPWLLPERHVATLGGPVTGLCVADRDAGSSEVVAVAATDGTVTLCRTNTGEIVRTLRGARGESLESFRVPAVQSATTGVAAAEAAAAAHRTGVLPAHCTADAMSRRLAPRSDLALVRRPVYTIQAYRDEVRDVFTGPSNGFFHGLRAVAPTYAHLTPQDETVADVLAGFGIHASAARAASSSPTATSALAPRQWYASAVTLAVAPDTRGGATSSDATAPLRDVWLLLGFPEGLLQVFVIPRRWFQLHLHGETRLDPPFIRFPIVSVGLHAGAVLQVSVSAARNLVASISEDGTTQLRRLTALHVPMRQFGVSLLVKAPPPAAAEMAASLASTLAGPAAPTASVGAHRGHTRTVTCCCVDDAHQLLVTGSADHTLCWWNLMAGSPPTPARVLSVRDPACNQLEATEDAGLAPVHGGYPIDVSFFYRHRRHTGDDAESSTEGDALYLLVLDTEQVVRVFEALTGRLVLVRAAADTAAGAVSHGGDPRVWHQLQLARYDRVNGADRLLLGGHSLVPWYLLQPRQPGAMQGHTEPILFSAWSAALRCVVTADAHHVLLWRVTNTAAVEVVRAWRIPHGIRALTLCDGDATGPSAAAAPSLLIALRERPLVVQYDCMSESPIQSTQSTSVTGDLAQMREPLTLRHLSLQPRRHHSGREEVDSDTDTSAAHVHVTAVTAVLHGSSPEPVQGDTAPPATAHACVVCHRGATSPAQEAPQSCALAYAWGVSDAPSAEGGAAELLEPSRQIELPRKQRLLAAAEDVVSALAVPGKGLLVLGGRRVLYVTTLCGTSSTAPPCSLLPTPHEAQRPSREGGGGGAAPPSASPLSAAVFPGPLVRGVRAVGPPAVTSEDGLGVVLAASRASLDGYLLRLASIGDEAPEDGAPSQRRDDVCLVLSGSNSGVVQLWDAQHAVELWRCRVALGEEAITTLTVQRCATRWLAVVGDQSGAVTVLDLTDTVSAARVRQKPPHGAAPAPAEELRAEALVVDRWQAHHAAVSGATFLAAEAAGSNTAHRLVTAGEDAAVVLWTLPLLPGGGFGCVDEGWQLFESPAKHPLRPSVLPLSWVARGAHARLRERYVHDRLFVRHPELQTDCAVLYASSSSTQAVLGISEASLLDRAWDALVADTHAVLAASLHDAAAVRAWCVSLSAASAGREVETAALPAEVQRLLLAFADRCCCAGDGGSGSTPPAAVRESLRTALHAVVNAGAVPQLRDGATASRQSVSAKADPVSTAAAVATPVTGQATASTGAARPAVELFCALAAVTALTGAPLPTTGDPRCTPSGGGPTVPEGPAGAPCVDAVSAARADDGHRHSVRRVVIHDRQSAAPQAKKSERGEGKRPRHGYKVTYSAAAPLVRVSGSAEDAGERAAGERRPAASPFHERGNDSISLGSTAAGGSAEPPAAEPAQRARRPPAEALGGWAGNAAAGVERPFTRASVGRPAAERASSRGAVDGASRAPTASQRTEDASPKERAASPAPPVVAARFLAPVLARSATGEAAPMTPVENVESGHDGENVALSSQLAWYAMRQHKRDVALEHGRLWNTSRVMRTLMGWSGTSPSGAAVPDADARAGGSRASSRLSEALVSSSGAPVLAQPVLALPHILAPHRTGYYPDGSGDRAASERDAALVERLHVPPSAAVDAAVPPGLPSRATLHEELAAMQALMRLSVQQRAAQQRSHQAAARRSDATSASPDAAEAVPSSDVRELSFQSALSQTATSQTVTSAAGEADGQSCLTLSSPRHVQFGAAAAAGPATPRLPSIAKGPTPVRQRRVLQTLDGGMGRRMAPMPLPHATTRRDIFSQYGSAKTK